MYNIDVKKSYINMDAKILLNNLDKIHSTKLGIERIKKNINLDDVDVIFWCINKIKDKNCEITRVGKNWYINADNIIITINASSYTIITAHIKK